MTDNNLCPHPADLEHYALGRLDEDRLEAVAEHLRDCPACLTQLESLQTESILTRSLRKHADVNARQTAIHEAEEFLFGKDVLTGLEQLLTRPSHSKFGLEAGVGREDLSFLAPAQESDELGRLAHYRVLQALGRGGMGLVFLAEDTKLNRPVALKVMRTRLAAREDYRERFLREARAMAAVKHDNVAAIYEVGEERIGEGESGRAGESHLSGSPPLPLSLSPPLPVSPSPETVPYLAMELLQGQSLATWLKKHSKPPIRWILRLGRQAASGLAAAHAKGLIHRDIKPGNLWLEDLWPLTPEFRVKVLDFGLAGPVDETSSEVAGTPAYMPPEQSRGESLDARCDHFALGCILYELCTGALPFPRDAEAIRERSFDYPPPRPISKANPTVPSPLAKLIHQMLAPVPADRPKSAQEVEQRLARIERRLWFHRQPSWVRWAGVAAVVLFLSGLVWGFAPLAWNLMKYGPTQPLVITEIEPDPSQSLSKGPPDENWLRLVRGLPDRQQAQAVAAKLVELNPGFDGKLSGVRFEHGQVIGLNMSTARVTDLSPLQAFGSLRRLSCTGSTFGLNMMSGQLADLSPLEGLPLEFLYVQENSPLTDFSPLRNTQLYHLDASGTGMTKLDDINGVRLGSLNISKTQVSDLSPIKNMPELRRLSCTYCPLESLEPLADTGVRSLEFSYRPERAREVLKRLTNLETINSLPAATFREQYGVSP